VRDRVIVGVVTHLDNAVFLNLQQVLDGTVGRREQTRIFVALA